MKLRATITIDIDVADYIAAGENQKRLHECFDQLKTRYENASLEIRERRAAHPRRTIYEPMVVRRPTGRVARYENA